MFPRLAKSLFFIYIKLTRSRLGFISFCSTRSALHLGSERLSSWLRVGLVAIEAQEREHYPLSSAHAVPTRQFGPCLAVNWSISGSPAGTQQEGRESMCAIMITDPYWVSKGRPRPTRHIPLVPFVRVRVRADQSSIEISRSTRRVGYKVRYLGGRMYG